MTVPVASEGTPVEAPPGPDFERRCAALRSRYVRLWLATPGERPRLGPPVGSRRRRANRRAAERLIGELGEEIERYPEREEERRRWRARLRERLQRFGEERLGWPGSHRRLLFADGFHDATVDFARAARRFDAALEPGEIGQAVRNVWIMNSLQMLLGLEVETTPAVFAYSMLYPYTDNYLDDPAVPRAAKRGLNRRLGRRLAGEAVAPEGERERRIFELVERIEGQFPRSRHPGPHLALRAIHRGQVRSLELQRSAAPPPAAVLRTQVEKGGASVLADGYLVAGDLSPEEEDFCFGYGVFLQLLDDLQDARGDREAGHATLFAAAAGRRQLDGAAGRLHRYMHRIVEGSRRFAAPEHAACRDLILRNCTFLLVGAVAEAPELFSRRFRRRLERQWPFGLRAMRRLRRLAAATWQESGGRLRRRRGVGSLWELLDPPPCSGGTAPPNGGRRAPPPARAGTS